MMNHKQLASAQGQVPSLDAWLMKLWMVVYPGPMLTMNYNSQQWTRPDQTERKCTNSSVNESAPLANW